MHNLFSEMILLHCVTSRGILYCLERDFYLWHVIGGVLQRVEKEQDVNSVFMKVKN